MRPAMMPRQLRWVSPVPGLAQIMPASMIALLMQLGRVRCQEVGTAAQGVREFVDDLGLLDPIRGATVAPPKDGDVL